MFRNIITICTGNICRSPIAEALLRQHLAPRGIEVCSAGTAALINYPADPLAQAVAWENGLDLSMHKARQATQAMLTEMDLILSLDQSHSDWVCTRYPQLRGRTYKLGRWTGNADVADPYGKSRQAFEQAYLDVNRGVTEWLKRL